MPLGPGGLDSNGIWLYGEDDSEALASDLLNLGMQSVSDALGSGVGKILQVVSTAKTDTFSSSSTSFTDITGLTATITPASASNKILVMVSLNASIPSTLTNGGQLRITRDATEIIVGDSAGSRTRVTFGNIVTTSGHAAHNYAMNYLDSPATASSITYGVELRMVSAHSGNINRSSTDADQSAYARSASTITVMEVAF